MLQCSLENLALEPVWSHVSTVCLARQVKILSGKQRYSYSGELGVMGSSTKASRTSQTMGVSSRTRDWAMRNCKRLFVVRT